MKQIEILEWSVPIRKRHFNDEQRRSDLAKLDCLHDLFWIKWYIFSGKTQTEMLNNEQKQFNDRLQNIGFYWGFGFSRAYLIRLAFGRIVNFTQQPKPVEITMPIKNPKAIIALRESTEKEVAAGMIIRVKSTFPLVLCPRFGVAKHDNTIRPCYNCRYLNAYQADYKFTLPQPTDFIDMIPQYGRLITIDLTKA